LQARVKTNISLSLRALTLGMVLAFVSASAFARLIPEEPASGAVKITDMVDPALRPVNSTQALKTAEQSVVRVLVVYRGYGGVPLDAVGMGSGFVVAPGKIITNYHVIEAPPEATATEIFIVPHKDSGASYQQVTLLKSWVEGDMALLSTEGLKIAPLTLSLVPHKNDKIVTMGYPGVTDRLLKRGGTELLQPTDAYVTQGSIALFASTNPDGSRVDTLFHTAPINPGNSGGPLMNECGQVVGVNTWSAASSLSEAGDMDVPAGQYVATHVSALNTFLQSAGIMPQASVNSCYAKTEDEIGKDEGLSQALAAFQEAELKRRDEERRAAATNELMDKLQLGALVLLSILALVLIWLLVQRRPHKEKDAPTAYSAPVAGEDITQMDDVGIMPPSPLSALNKPKPSKRPIPWGWMILAGFIVLLTTGFLLRESPLFKHWTTPKAQTQVPSGATVRLNCEVDTNASPQPLKGAGPIDFEFNASQACINGRTPYEVQSDGSLLRFTVSESDMMAARLELSKDGSVFKRSDYRLDPTAHKMYVDKRTALGTLRCASNTDEGQQKALVENLQKVKILANSYLIMTPETQTVWRCHKAADK
jgi:serine protease Do